MVKSLIQDTTGHLLIGESLIENLGLTIVCWVEQVKYIWAMCLPASLCLVVTTLKYKARLSGPWPAGQGISSSRSSVKPSTALRIRICIFLKLPGALTCPSQLVNHRLKSRPSLSLQLVCSHTADPWVCQGAGSRTVMWFWHACWESGEGFC